MPPIIKSSQLSAIPNVTHGFFGRQGGVSEGDFDSLNVGYEKGDCSINVNENRARVCAALKAQPHRLLTVNQTHSNKVHLAISSKHLGEKIEADAIVTMTPGLLIGVMTADCVPILLSDKKGRIVAAIHSGWKGASIGITENVLVNIDACGIPRDDLIAAIGPCIWQDSYEIGEDLRQQFTGAEHCFKPGKGQGKWQFDLSGFVELILRREGVRHIDSSPFNTYTHEAEFFSFRRATHQGKVGYGNNLSAIMINEDS